MKNKFLSCFFLLGMFFLGIILFGCSKSTSQDMAVAENVVYEKTMATSAKNASFRAAGYQYSDVMVEEAVAEAEIGGSGNTGGVNQQERKLIKTGSVNLEVENLASAEQAVETWCKNFNGYISSSYNQENSASFTVRIPSAKFDLAMDTLGDLGKIKYRSLSTQDVSEQFYDLQTRLETRKILRDRLQSYLASAKDMKDMLQIERELNDTLSEIESMEGSMRRLSGQIDYSTINVELQLPYRTTDQGFQWPNLSNGVRRFLSNLVDFFVGLITALLYVVICGVPIIAIIAFFYWLLFGKVGLLKKIFRNLSKKD